MHIHIVTFVCAIYKSENRDISNWSRLKAGGLRLFAVVAGVEPIDAWHKISIGAWLQA